MRVLSYFFRSGPWFAVCSVIAVAGTVVELVNGSYLNGLWWAIASLIAVTMTVVWWERPPWASTEAGNSKARKPGSRVRRLRAPRRTRLEDRVGLKPPTRDIH